jgi:hypothetical protein
MAPEKGRRRRYRTYLAGAERRGVVLRVDDDDGVVWRGADNGRRRRRR